MSLHSRLLGSAMRSIATNTRFSMLRTQSIATANLMTAPCYNRCGFATTAFVADVANNSGDDSTNTNSSNTTAKGLMQFYDNEKGWVWNSMEYRGAREWSVDELANKSFEDLHKLHWTCIKELNKLYSQSDECRRFKLFFPHNDKVELVRKTIRNIRSTLLTRRSDWMRARVLLKVAEDKTALLEANPDMPKENVDEIIRRKYNFRIGDVGLDKRIVTHRAMRRTTLELRRANTKRKNHFLTFDVV